jgi:hypothetical protein
VKRANVARRYVGKAIRHSFSNDRMFDWTAMTSIAGMH